MLEKRLNEYRLLHSFSVSDTAKAMAELYGVDSNKAMIAGLLHDWDKNFSDQELFALVAKYGLELPWSIEDMGSILHAITGAESVRRTFPELDADVISSIARHTTGAVDMSDLDIIIYVADMIEPLRSQRSLAPLRAAVGKISLDQLFLQSYEVSMSKLIRRHRFIHPQSIEVWNAYIFKEKLTQPTAKIDKLRRISDANS